MFFTQCLSIDQILDLNIIAESLISRLVFGQKWIDPRLEWETLKWIPEKCKFAKIEYLRLPIDMLWKPEIVMYNNIDGNYIEKG